MTIRRMIVEELKKSEQGVLDLVDALRKRPDLRWWQRLYLWTVASGDLYVKMRRMEDDGLVESFGIESTLTKLMLVRWRAAPEADTTCDGGRHDPLDCRYTRCVSRGRSRR